jgi:hypothetical protein
MKGGWLPGLSRSIACIAALAPLAACTPPATCLLQGQQPMIQVDLYFGRYVKSRPPVSEAEWADFVTHSVAPKFPDGFTVLDASGQWLSPATRRVTREPTKLMQIVTPGRPDLAERVRAVIDAYKARFHQEAVGVTSATRCAAF